MNTVNKILYRTNLLIEQEAKNILLNPTFYNNYRIEESEDHYSSFNNRVNSLEELQFTKYCNKFYFLQTNNFLKLSNLRVGSESSFDFWWQLYNDKTKGHNDHTHFEVATPISLFSFVHFINIDENDPCFHFLNEDGTEEYINEKPNDFIVFGSWSRHRVKKPSSSQIRAIVAGNISIHKHINVNQFF